MLEAKTTATATATATKHPSRRHHDMSSFMETTAILASRCQRQRQRRRQRRRQRQRQRQRFRQVQLFSVIFILHQFLLKGAAVAAATLTNNHGSVPGFTYTCTCAYGLGSGSTSNRRNFLPSFSSRSIESTSFLDTTLSRPSECSGRRTIANGNYQYNYDYDYDYNYACNRNSNSNSNYISDKSNLLVMMAKGDGKQRRKKQEVSPSPPPARTQPAAPRVSNDINIPIKRQIMYGKLNKQFRESGGTSFRQNNKKVTRTKYRRKWDEDEIEQKAEERRRRGQNPNWDVILNQTAAAPLVIVDGYNIIYKWPRLKKHMNKGDTNRARQLLLDDLENLRSIKGWRIEVVYDGAGRNPRKGPLGDSRKSVSAADRASTKEVSKFGVREVYTGSGIEADSYIEARCGGAKNVTGGAFSGSFIVATDDAMIRLAGQNAGALCMGADRFVNELKAVKKAVSYRVEAAMARVNGEAMRPEKLWGTKTFARSAAQNTMANALAKDNKSKSKNKNDLDTTMVKKPPSTDPLDNLKTTGDGKTVFTSRLGRTVIIEDKRKKKPRKKKGS